MLLHPLCTNLAAKCLVLLVDPKYGLSSWRNNIRSLTVDLCWFLLSNTLTFAGSFPPVVGSLVFLVKKIMEYWLVEPPVSTLVIESQVIHQSPKYRGKKRKNATTYQSFWIQTRSGLLDESQPPSNDDSRHIGLVETHMNMVMKHYE